ncbi:MAG: F0F1 ATP synthase subunit gamma, partial [Myxococcota bacterium]
MPSLKDIRTRINATKNTRKITSAMKLVAAAKLKRATDAVQASRPYANKMVHLIDQLASFLEEDAHPLLEQPEREDHLLVIICSSDRGLAGGFNANLFRAVDRFLKSKQDLSESIRLVTIGRKAYQYYRNSGF